MHLSAAETFKVQHLIACLLLLIGSSSADYFFHRCLKTTNYTSGSPYQTNLNSLLVSLKTDGPITGFCNATAGEDPNKVYGRALCRGDISTSDCSSCLNSASTQILQRCPTSKDAIIWFDECQIVYYSKKFVFNTSTVIRAGGYNDENITEPVLFIQKLGPFMRDLVNEAASGSSKFAARESNFTGATILYAMAQCGQDLSRVECNDCLGNAVADAARCCSNARGVRYLYDSCTVRYEVYPFFRIPVSPPASPTVIYKWHNLTTVIAVAISIAAVVVVLSVISTYLMTKNKYKKLQAESGIRNKESQIFDSSTVKP